MEEALSVIAAVTKPTGSKRYDEAYGIGKGGNLPWTKLKRDMERFRALTMGHPVIMGRKTYESLPGKFRPLPGRTNIVLTRNQNWHEPDVVVVHGDSIHSERGVYEAVRQAKDYPGSQEIFVIGGSSLYREAISLADRLYLTQVDCSASGCDAFFPSLGIYSWYQIREEAFKADENNEYGGLFCTYLRQKQSERAVSSPAAFSRHVAVEHARSEGHRALLERIVRDGVCPFCPGNISQYHPKPILGESRYWTVIENIKPYDGARVHLVIIYHQHVTSPAKIPGEAYEDLYQGVLPWAERKFDIPGGTFLMRFGDFAYTGGSVDHLHLHLIAGVPRDQGGEAIRAKVGYHL